MPKPNNPPFSVPAPATTLQLTRQHLAEQEEVVQVQPWLLKEDGDIESVPQPNFSMSFDRMGFGVLATDGSGWYLEKSDDDEWITIEQSDQVLQYFRDHSLTEY